MGTAVYNVVGTSRGWIIEHDDKGSPPYEFPEAAFEAAVAAASPMLKNRESVVVPLSFPDSIPAAIDPPQS
jgi:hypothetical protein